MQCLPPALAFVVLLLTAMPANCADAETDIPAGHSYHGEAFNEGPRQSAVQIPGMAKIDFATSAKSKSTQSFIEQGIAQLHGFWYLEAERSFRQAAKLEPELAIAYWGMAMANHNNDARARGFINEAKLKSKKGTSEREKMYIDALDRYLPKKVDDDNSESDLDDKQKAKRKEDKRKRTERYLADIEKIIHRFPDDIEAKALLVVQLWLGDRNGVKLASRYAVSALQSEIFAVDPMHPTHHYRIHLWDSARPDNALKSAAKCGPSSPGIAHMWHMPGHIYSKLKRYGDAAWQQEASARVDHAHMIRTRLLPDQIHNFAHNNEWLVRNLVFLGRVNDAIDLSKNLISLPRHPKYNSLSKRGSYKYGRQRLVLVLSQYGLWDELAQELDGGLLKYDKDTEDYLELLSWDAVAKFMTDNKADGAKALRQLQRERLDVQREWLDLADDKDASSKDKKPTLKKKRDTLNRLISRAAAAAATKRKDSKAVLANLERSKLDVTIKARWLDLAGKRDEAIKLVQQAARDRKSEVLPLAILVDLLWKSGKKELAIKRLRSLTQVAATADLDTPLLKRLTPITEEAGLKLDWRKPTKAAGDIGERPPLDSLGPFRWHPYQSPDWTALDSSGNRFTDQDIKGQPTLVVMYLGFGCLHCIEQLQALSPRVGDFESKGINVLGVSNESLKNLKLGIESFDKEMRVPLYTDAVADSSDSPMFKAFRCWDDFEEQPLHGTFLIDGDGKVRWQDISYEPFMEIDFLLDEAERLLSLE